MDLSFTEFEKSIIRKMSNAKNLDERSALQFFCSDDYIAIETDDEFSEVKVIFKDEPSIEFQLSVFDRLCEIVFLLNKLESNRLIGFINFSNKENHSNYIYDNSKYERTGDHFYMERMPDAVFLKNRTYKVNSIILKKTTFSTYFDVGNKIYTYANSSFYVSSELKELVRNNFKTPEQRRHIFTSVLSIIAIIVAIAIGLFSILNSHNRTDNAIIKTNKVETITPDSNSITPR